MKISDFGELPLRLQTVKSGDLATVATIDALVDYINKINNTHIALSVAFPVGLYSEVTVTRPCCFETFASQDFYKVVSFVNNLDLIHGSCNA